MKRINIGIDASRNRSGGALAHIIGIISGVIVDRPLGINQIHIWSYPELLRYLPESDFIIKHSPLELQKSLSYQIFWQYFNLKKEAKQNKIDIMLNTDAGTVCRFKPSVTMSRDMLSYEKGEMKRFGISFQRFRLLILKYVQNSSLKNSVAAIFLTKYASNVIQLSSGSLKKIKIIPHGVNEEFRIKSNYGFWEESKVTVKCVYVSNIDLYKHQWNIALAISKLREEGFNVTVDFIGGGTKKAQNKLESVLNQIEDYKLFIFKHEFVSNKELPNYLIDKDIFIFASSCENMPNTLLEGMCTGLPIACSDRGPMPEVLKDGGLYFDPENITSIKESIKKIITNETLRVKLSQRAVELSKQYSWKRCSSETFDFLLSLV